MAYCISYNYAINIKVVRQYNKNATELNGLETCTIAGKKNDKADSHYFVIGTIKEVMDEPDWWYYSYMGFGIEEEFPVDPSGHQHQQQRPFGYPLVFQQWTSKSYGG
ncbi:hypothetical protein Ahy_B10g105667 isoform D [Arachis hypogaea]|uniref:Uncharacterized protein n=1 Tax=Arachis hypogaea TaxID=3818 RepID=A0A444X8K1_ARAHY|nr:hypothetical protein Ahy_B10g105667 isoform D [Arachis hypogaea]